MKCSTSKYIFWLLLLAPFFAQGQPPLKKIKEIKPGEVAQATVDRLGNFFLVLKNGAIRKYDPQGKVMAKLRARACTLIEPWYHPSIFIYDKKKQAYSIYGRNFENEKVDAVGARLGHRAFPGLPQPR
jgi:hypothetical protein